MNEDTSYPLYLSTSQLRPGDVVLCHGMRLLIDGDPKTYPGDRGNTVYVWPTRVTNMDGVRMNDSFIRYHVTHGTGSKDVPRWPIQGNDLAHWWVERYGE
jgi:hypothetical protein